MTSSPSLEKRLALVILSLMILVSSAGNDESTATVGPFQLRMYWTESSCWQDDCSHQKWCMQCEGFRCNVGDIVWVEPCRPEKPLQQQFYWNPVAYFPNNGDGGLLDSKSGNLRTTSSVSTNFTVTIAGEPKPPASSTGTFGQLQVRSVEVIPNPDTPGRVTYITRFLCLERVGERMYKLQTCEGNRHQQWFRGLQTNVPFELYPPPLTQPPGRHNNDKCMNTHHHPRQFEEIIHTPCVRSQGLRTNLWETVFGSSDGEDESEEVDAYFDPFEYYQLRAPREDPRCRQDATCGLCQGHCVTDDDCAGELVCFERERSNSVEAPPGCYGKGVPSK
jgi:hypothetical protein